MKWKKEGTVGVRNIEVSFQVEVKGIALSLCTPMDDEFLKDGAMLAGILIRRVAGLCISLCLFF